ncbi:MAG: SagB/ThcOx family dehydrogenase, partial [Nitrospinales bacterium]
MDSDAIEKVVYYHERTKHDYRRYANGPGYMDWANQPNPFRKFSGAPFIYLPIVNRDESPPYKRIFETNGVEPCPVTAYTLSRFHELSLAVSAWKQAGDSRWALRSNPSSGNLHPTEGYLVVGGVEGIQSGPGVYHYAPEQHGLELRTRFAPEIWRALMKGFPSGAFLTALSSIHWRESWKYGERAFRYCQHDIGHALAAYRVAAAAMGWRLVLLEGASDDDIANLLGLNRDEDFLDAEREHPDLVAVVFGDAKQSDIPLSLDPALIAEIARGAWQGKANRLSGQRSQWEIIDTVAAATVKAKSQNVRRNRLPVEGDARIAELAFSSVCQTPRRQRVKARQIIRQRRSAMAFDGVTHLTREDFYLILSHAALSKNAPGMPWDAISWTPYIHLCLFVHRVHGLKPGLYILARDPEKILLLKKSMKEEFLWEKPESCPDLLPLYLLKTGDYRRTAAQVSCNQEIAGQSAFSLAMVAEFAPSLRKHGAWFYRRLFWESGMIGQMLYLAAEFVGARGTGIGCYFDNPVHDLLGFKDRDFQSLYHFTIGGPVE